MASGSGETPCQIQPLTEPLIFKPFQTLDEGEYAAHPAKPPLLCRVLDLFLPLDLAPAPPPLTRTDIATLVMSGVSLLLLLYLVFTR